MNKLLLAVVVAVLAILGVTSVASATMTNRSVGQTVRANGIFAFTAGAITATCDNLVLSGTVTSMSSVAGSGGTVNGCDNADVMLSGRWVKGQVLGSPRSGTWTLGPIAVQVVGAGGLLNCYYHGNFSGNWSSNGVDTMLMITGNSLVFTRSSGIFPCTGTLVIHGTLTLLGVISS